MQKKFILVILMTIPIILGVNTVYADDDIPAWVKGVAGFWAENKITDKEFIEALEFLIESDIIQTNDPRVLSLENEVLKLENKIKLFESENTSPDGIHDLSLMKNNTEYKSFLTGNPYHCNKYDKIKSGALNGTYNSSIICHLPGLYLSPVNVTYEEQIAECRNLYDELAERTKVVNDSVCADLGIPDCQALVMHEWDVFQKKFCNWEH